MIRRILVTGVPVMSSDDEPGRRDAGDAASESDKDAGSGSEINLAMSEEDEGGEDEDDGAPKKSGGGLASRHSGKGKGKRAKEMGDSDTDAGDSEVEEGDDEDDESKGRMVGDDPAEQLDYSYLKLKPDHATRWGAERGRKRLGCAVCLRPTMSRPEPPCPCSLLDAARPMYVSHVSFYIYTCGRLLALLRPPS